MRFAPAVEAACASHAIRAEHRALVAAALADVARERRALRAARRAELLRSGRERFTVVMRGVLLAKSAVADGKARTVSHGAYSPKWLKHVLMQRINICASLAECASNTCFSAE